MSAIMNELPVHLLDKILFKLDLKSLWKLRCANRSMQSRIYGPWFASKYISQMPSDLLQIATHGSAFLSYQPYDYSRPVRITNTFTECQVLGSCSGLLLLFINDGLCVANPLTKKFRFLNRSMSMWLTRLCTRDTISCLGLAVNQIDLNTRGFKLVYLIDRKPGYKFEIYSGNAWRHSKTKITCDSRSISNLMKRPVFVDGSLYWLRDDGSILAFNPETEQARLIPVEFPPELHSKTLFAASASNLTLISATVEVIYVYAIKDVVNDPKWILVKQIKNGAMDVKRLGYWNVEAYDGKCLVLIEGRKKIAGSGYDRVVHVYDFLTNKWIVVGSMPLWSDATQDVVPFTPSPYSVVGLNDEILACSGNHISSISAIMGLINGIPSEEMEKHLRKRSLEERENKIASWKKMKTA